MGSQPLHDQGHVARCMSCAGANVPGAPETMVGNAFGKTRFGLNNQRKGKRYDRCAGYIAGPLSKEAVFTPEIRWCHPSFPVCLPGSRSP
jgi:hypothetical protein